MIQYYLEDDTGPKHIVMEVGNQDFYTLGMFGKCSGTQGCLRKYYFFENLDKHGKHEWRVFYFPSDGHYERCIKRKLSQAIDKCEAKQALTLL